MRFNDSLVPLNRIDRLDNVREKFGRYVHIQFLMNGEGEFLVRGLFIVQSQFLNERLPNLAFEVVIARDQFQLSLGGVPLKLV